METSMRPGGLQWSPIALHSKTPPPSASPDPPPSPQSSHPPPRHLPGWTPPPRSIWAGPRSLCWRAWGRGLWHRSRGRRVAAPCGERKRKQRLELALAEARQQGVLCCALRAATHFSSPVSCFSRSLRGVWPPELQTGSRKSGSAPAQLTLLAC